jgi:hypothetical protein
LKYSKSNFDSLRGFIATEKFKEQFSKRLTCGKKEYKLWPMLICYDFAYDSNLNHLPNHYWNPWSAQLEPKDTCKHKYFN